jgi:hypothetical protein
LIKQRENLVTQAGQIGQQYNALPAPDAGSAEEQK